MTNNSSSTSPNTESHSDDIAVDRFAMLMKSKLAAARAKGRGGWDDPARCNANYLRKSLHEHVAKGDPVDVANFCMMLAHYGASTATPDSPSECPECGDTSPLEECATCGSYPTRKAALDSRAGDATCDQCKGYGYLITAPSTCSEGGEKMPCTKCQMPAATILATPAPAVDAVKMPERDYSDGEDLAVAIHNSMRFRALENINQAIRHLEDIIPANDVRDAIVGLLDALCLKVSENLPEASHIVAAQALSKAAVDAVPAGEVERLWEALEGVIAELEEMYRATADTKADANRRIEHAPCLIAARAALSHGEGR